jgi:hypothetical protein
LHFRAEDADSLLFLYKPVDACLWVLQPQDQQNPYLPDLPNRELDPIARANLGRITTSETGEAPPIHIFGDMAADNWCYYFEKADLARQFGDWDGVLALMAEAEARSFAPRNGLEWFPLLAAQAHLGYWDAAESLSAEIHAMDGHNDAMLCSLWDQFFTETGFLGEDGKAARRAVRQIASCE